MNVDDRFPPRSTDIAIDVRSGEDRHILRARVCHQCGALVVDGMYDQHSRWHDSKRTGRRIEAT